jgi:hypothetical protein
VGRCHQLVQLPQQGCRLEGDTPRKGDIIVGHMQSGRNIAIRVDGVQRAGNPPDMFHADVTVLGYAGEVELPEQIRGVRGLRTKLERPGAALG